MDDEPYVLDVEASERAWLEYLEMQEHSRGTTVKAAEAMMAGTDYNPARKEPVLPTGYDERKALKMYDFMFHYFPLAWLEVVKVAVAGSAQHNPGEALHWAREKSADQMNTAFRHIFDYGTGFKWDTDGRAHLGKAIWRLMAQLQLDIEAGK